MWLSKSGENLTLSFCFYLKKRAPNTHFLAQLLSLSCAKLISKYHLFPSIKWPNDILIKGKKIAGVLSEIQESGPYLFAVNGLGLNVNALDFEGLSATSLSLETLKTYSLPDIKSEITHIFLEDVQLFLKQGFSPFLSDYRSYLMHKKGDLLRFHINDKLTYETFHSVSPEGGLNIIDKDGKIKTLYCGEILPS